MCLCSKFDVDTFRGYRKLATLGNLDGLLWRIIAAGLDILDLVDNFIALEDLTEDNVTTIEPAVQC